MHPPCLALCSSSASPSRPAWCWEPDAQDVVPRAPLPATAYLPPALRASACAATLAGCPYTRPLASASQACLAVLSMAEPLRAAPYMLPRRRTAEEQAAVEAAGRPGRSCAFPLLVPGPQLPPRAAASAAAILTFLQACQG